MTDRVLAYLRTRGPLTPTAAATELGCLRLGARIWDLKQRGHAIDAEIVEDGDGTRVVRYALADPPAPVDDRATFIVRVLEAAQREIDCAVIESHSQEVGALADSLMNVIAVVRVMLAGADGGENGGEAAAADGGENGGEGDGSGRNSPSERE
jgi:hypothetical protein